MALPTPESLLPQVAALERSLALLQVSLESGTFPAASPDNNVKATARGSVFLQSVTIASTELTGDPVALASKVLSVCQQALSAANADSAAKSATAAASYALTGIPGPLFPPPSDTGFDGEVGNALAVSATLKRTIQAMQFEGIAGVARAIVDGTLELRKLEYAPPLPQVVSAPLEVDTAAAINIALDKAKRLFEEEIKKPVKEGGDPRPQLADPRPRALMLVEDTSGLRAADAAIRSRLNALGFQVEAKRAPSSVAADGNGRSLIFISETVEPADIASKFTNAAVPVIVCEPVSLKDLKMTGTTQGTDYDSLFGQTKLTISTTHPLAAGLSGTVTVTSASSKFVWGNPASAARKVGAIFGSTTRWGIFGYDTGDAMVGMNAPARRVGFFAGRDTAGAFTAEGWRLFDAAVRWATAARALLTVKAQPTAGSGDDLLKRRLEERHGLEVTIRLETDTKTSDLGDMRVHVISESVTPSAVTGRYVNSVAPTVVCDANLFDDMKMTGLTLNTDFGEVDSQTDLQIVAPAGDPLAGGLTGTVTVVTSGQRFEWGKPGAEATSVAQLINRPTSFGIFGYQGGANMVGMRAPAPRVGFFASTNAPPAFTPDGWTLFDAAVIWARSPRVLLVVGTTPRPDDDFLRKRLEQSFGFIVETKLAKDLVDQHSLGKHVIVISESVTPTDVAAKLTAVAVPVVSLEPAVFKDLKMTDVNAADVGTATNQTELDLIKVDHALAAGLPAGRLAVATAPSRLAWGRPASAAVKIARIVNTTDHWALFGYETGATMVGRTAPARRVGCFVGEQTGPVLTENGLRLFDAAVLWAAGRIEVRGGGGIGPITRGTPPGGGPAPTPKQTWQVGVAYKIGDEVTHLGLDYRCRIAHTSQSDWEPQRTFNLWERINAGGVWTVQVIYKVGDEVSFQGHFYRCIQGHQSQPDWTPTTPVPALWQRLD